MGYDLYIFFLSLHCFAKEKECRREAVRQFEAIDSLRRSSSPKFFDKICFKSRCLERHFDE